MEIKSINSNEYIEKINKIESMLEEIKKGFLLERDFQESIKRGERDIEDGKITTCKTERELDDFFASI